MKEKQTFCTKALFLFYLALLVWIILFKLQFSLDGLIGVRAVNLIPFYYEREAGSHFHIREVLDNVLIFVPMGIYLQMLAHESRFPAKLAVIFGTSLLLEGAQYALAVGRTDITDLITNTTGGLLGLALYALIARLLRDRARADRLFFILAAVTSVLISCLLALLVYVN